MADVIRCPIKINLILRVFSKNKIWEMISPFAFFIICMTVCIFIIYLVFGVIYEMDYTVGTSLEDYVVYQKGEFLDSAYLQQNSFDPVDASVTVDRQRLVFSVMYDILTSSFALEDKKDARLFFNELRQRFLDWNGTAESDERFGTLKEDLESFYKGRRK